LRQLEKGNALSRNFTFSKLQKMQPTGFLTMQNELLPLPGTNIETQGEKTPIDEHMSLTKDEHQLLHLLQHGDDRGQDEAFRQLYQQYYGLIESIVVTNSGSPEQAKDVFQDGIIVLFNRVRKGDFQLTSSLKSYLFAICRNLWLMKLRTAGREPALENHHERIPLEEDLFKTLESTERQQLIAGLMAKLGEDCRRILDLFYYQKMSMAKIMDAFGLGSEQAAKNKKSQCLGKLREMVMTSNFYRTALTD
jgi:RNA polymerase sigma factor (sigma-70 family)